MLGRSLLPAILIVGLLAFSGLAGCLSNEDAGPQSDVDAAVKIQGQVGTEPWRANKTLGAPSEKIYTEFITEQIYVPSKDGTRIGATVYRPVVPDGVKVPVVLTISPYSSGASSRPLWLDPIRPLQSNQMERELAPRGYAVATADVRGTNNSDGCFDYRGLKEREDGYAVVEYLGTREWSNGNVGMLGVSYLGATQEVTAVTAPPHLKTIVPIAATTSVYRYLHHDGAKYQGNTATIPAYYSGVISPGLDANPMNEEWFVGRAWEATCSHDQILLPGLLDSGDYEVSGNFRSNLRHYWSDRDLEKDAGNITASVFLIHGFLDDNVKTDNIQSFFEKLNVPKRALLGQWGHAYPIVGQGTPADWWTLATRWFDYWLKDIDTGVMDEPTVLVQDNKKVWREFGRWPPSDVTKEFRFYLSNAGGQPAAGKLSTSVPVGNENPQRFEALLNGVPAQGRTVELRFASEALETELNYIGVPTLSLHGATTANQKSYWVAILYDIQGDSWTRVNYGYMNLRHREGIKSPQPIEPGKMYEFNISLYPRDYVFEAGHKIGLAIRGTDGNTFPDPGQPTDTLFTGAEHPSFLSFPRFG